MHIFKFSLLAVIIGCVSIPAFAQNAEDDEDTPPPAFGETEIFLFDYNPSGTNDALSNVRNVTNRIGYDNQPFFTPDSNAFLYSRDDGVQTDIWEYNISDNTHRQITDNEKSEFSPTPSPDNSKISVVFERSNSIWTVKRNKADKPYWTLEAANITEPVGYFAQNFDTVDILYWSRYGFNVALTHVDNSTYHYISGSSLPATPHIIPGTNTFSFVHRQGNDSVWIKSFNPNTKAVTPITPIVGTNINYTWAPDGSILQIEDTELFRWTEDAANWAKISDLADHGLESGYRIDVSPDGKRIAIVGLPESSE